MGLMLQLRRQVLRKTDTQRVKNAYGLIFKASLFLSRKAHQPAWQPRHPCIEQRSDSSSTRRTERCSCPRRGYQKSSAHSAELIKGGAGLVANCLVTGPTSRPRKVCSRCVYRVGKLTLSRHTSGATFLQLMKSTLWTRDGWALGDGIARSCHDALARGQIYVCPAPLAHWP
jgi:hypothetical protein